MIALKTTKNRYKLAAKTSLCPEVESDTRWDSIGEMISKGLRLREVLPLCSFDRHTMALIPSPPDWGRLEELHGHLNAFKAVSKWLQTGVTEERDRKEVNFATCRVAFDTLIDMFPAERGKKGVKHWLGPDADIIHDKYFEREQLRESMEGIKSAISRRICRGKWLILSLLLLLRLLLTQVGIFCQERLMKLKLGTRSMYRFVISSA